MSTLATAATSYFVYSSLSFYGPHRDHALPGRWFVRALGDAGQEEAAVRQTLHRLERSGALNARPEGREKLYSASAYARAEIEAGLAKIFGTPSEAWDGVWTVVVARFQPGERNERDQFRSLMDVEGFASLAPGVFIHPRAAAIERIEKAAGNSRRFCTIRGSVSGGLVPHNVASLWDLKDLARRYRRFIDRFEPQLHGRLPPPRDCFLRRFALVFEFLGIAWQDPDMPPELLPDSWRAPEARDVARRLYERLLPGAIRHADAIYDSLYRGESK